MSNNTLTNALFDVVKNLYLKSDGSLGTEADTNLKGIIPAVPPSSFGSKAFRDEFSLKYSYVGGAMVGGISSAAMVKAFAEGGCLGIYGASGNPPALVDETIQKLQSELNGKTFGSCLINTPHDPSWESKVIEIYLNRGVNLIEASAFMQLTPSLVRYRLTGLHRDDNGRIIAPNRIMAKVSRLELAKRFFSPPPEKMVRALLADGLITESEAELSSLIPMAQDLTAEADSGGHTDFRPALSLWPAMAATAAEFSKKFNYQDPIRVGFGGGIGTPWALLAAQNLGASYFVTGSINQACCESGVSSAARAILAKAGQADVTQGPAADMFEFGAKVQVLKFGTLYAMRAQKLADIYRQYPSIESIPESEKENIETQIFKNSLESIWEQTSEFFKLRDPLQLEKAIKDPKHKMSLIFRWYLGQASRWAISGLEERRADWQIFCGPSQGAFNEWAKGSVYEAPENRKVVDLAMNILYGAAVLSRFNLAKLLGEFSTQACLELKPQDINILKKYL